MATDPITISRDLLVKAAEVCKKLRRRKPSMDELISVAEFLGHFQAHPAKSEKLFEPRSFHEVSELTVQTIIDRILKQLDPIIEKKLTEEWFQPPTGTKYAAKGHRLTSDQKDQIIRLSERGLSATQISRELNVDARRVGGYIRTMINSGRMASPQRK